MNMVYYYYFHFLLTGFFPESLHLGRSTRRTFGDNWNRPSFLAAMQGCQSTGGNSKLWCHPL